MGKKGHYVRHRDGPHGPHCWEWVNKGDMYATELGEDFIVEALQFRFQFTSIARFTYITNTFNNPAGLSRTLRVFSFLLRGEL